MERMEESERVNEMKPIVTPIPKKPKPKPKPKEKTLSELKRKSVRAPLWF